MGVAVSSLLVLAACAGPGVVEEPAPTEPSPAPPPLVPVAEGARHPARQLGRFLGVDRSEIVGETEWTPPLPGAWGWPACDEAQTAAAVATLGPLQGCNAAGGLVAAGHGPPQDCPSGCFYDQAVGRVRDGRLVPVAESVWPSLRAPREGVLSALFVPWLEFRDTSDRRRGLSVTCDRKVGTEPDASTPGRVGKAVFGPDDTCVVTWTVDPPYGVREPTPLPVAVLELGVTGTLWIRDDGSMDGSELRFAPRHAQLETHLVLERDVVQAATLTRREVTERRPVPAPGPLCDPATPRDRLPRRLDACGPSGGSVSVVGFVVDGHLKDPRLQGETPLDPKFEACAVEALTAVEVAPAGCVSLPVAMRISGALVIP